MESPGTPATQTGVENIDNGHLEYQKSHTYISTT